MPSATRSPLGLSRPVSACSTCAHEGPTSVAQIDRTYGHLLPDSIDRARTALEAFGHGTATAEEVEGELLDEKTPA